MPLNVHDAEDSLGGGNQIPQPITRRPKPDSTILKNRLMTLIVIGITATAVFLVLYFFFGTERQGIPAPPAVQIETKEEIPPAPPASPQRSNETGSEGISGDRADLGESARYTIIIGTYTAKEIAREEVTRWRTAGYDCSIVEDGNLIRVALGRYRSEPEARADAERMSEMFEQGFLIIPLN